MDSNHTERSAPLRWGKLDADDRLGFIPVHLEAAAAADDVAWNLSGCFDSVRSRERTTVISSSIRDELTRLIIRAEIAAHAALPEFYMRDIHSGMQALAELFDLWTNPEELRPSAGADNCDRRRILQNICHNEALRENIDNRAYARRAVEIKALIDAAARLRRAAG